LANLDYKPDYLTKTKDMKLFLSTLSLLMAVFFISPMQAQSTKEIKKDIHSKSMKEARKESKKLAKEGFAVSPGQLPMDKQIEDVWLKRRATDDEGTPMYFIADARSVGETHAAAKMQAYELAKINLAGQIGTEVAGLIETTVANSQLSAEDASSVTQTIGTFKSKVISEMGRILTLLEASRNIDKNSEVYITLAYSQKTAMEMAKKIIREELTNKADLNAETLDKILDF
jgi:hypothetical protein